MPSQWVPNAEGRVTAHRVDSTKNTLIFLIDYGIVFDKTTELVSVTTMGEDEERYVPGASRFSVFTGHNMQPVLPGDWIVVKDGAVSVWPDSDFKMYFTEAEA